MGLAESIFGTPGTTNFIKSGGSQASPGYNFSKQFYDWLPQLMQQAYPAYQGSIDPGMGSTLQDAIRRAQGYAQSGPSEILQGVQGTLGSFMAPNFLNPWNAMQGGNPNYGMVNPMQRIYGGQPASGYGGFAGGNPGMGTPPGRMGGVPPLGGGYGGGQGAPVGTQSLGGSSARPGMPYGGGQGFAAGEPAPGSMPGGGMSYMNRQGQQTGMPQLGGMPGGGFGGGQTAPPPLGQSAPGQAPGGAGSFGSALNMNFNDAQGALSRMFQGNSGGLNNALAGQYGMNQYGQQNDGRDQFMHSTDHLSALQRTLGREPTFDEVQQSLRSGPGAIEQARSLFQQDDPNGRASWGAGQSAYGNLVDQYGLAKGGQMFQQQFGNGPMWAGGAPGAAPSQGGPPSPPIAAPSAPAGAIPPLGGSAAPTMPGGPPDPMARPPISITPNPTTGSIKPLGSTPTTSGPTRPVITPKPVSNIPTVKPRPVTPGRPGSTDQPVAKPTGGAPGQVFNPKTGNWHTPGAGKKRLNLATSP